MVRTEPATNAMSDEADATAPDPEWVMPKRKWKDDEPAPATPPLILVSSHDGHGDPAGVSNRSAAWRSVKRAAERPELGWTVTVTYALAWLADRYFLNGNLAKGAHHVHSVALRLARGAQRGAAVWVAESATPEVPDKGWAFDSGRYRGGPPAGLNLTEFKEGLRCPR